LTEQSPQYAVGAPIESIDFRGRAATSAPLKSCLAYDAGLQDRLFHGGTRSIEAFPIQTLFGRESSLSATSENWFSNSATLISPALLAFFAEASLEVTNRLRFTTRRSRRGILK